MAAAILIDATVVRGVLLPAALSLLGDRAWHLRRHAGRGIGRTGRIGYSWASGL
jgi:putative drug exporter of the RND superfamily